MPTLLKSRPRGRLVLASVCLGGAVWLCTVLPAAAFDGDRFKLDASSVLTYDDNVARVAGVAPQSDEILTTGVGAEAHLQYSRQQYDATVELNHGYYRHLRTQDYSATNARIGIASDVGNAGRVAVSLEQAQSLTPLSNLQALIRNLVTTRRAGLTGSYALDARYSLDAALTRIQTRDDFSGLRFNDSDSTAKSVGLSYALPEGSRVGVRETFTRTDYPNPAPILSGPFLSLYDPSSSARQTELYGSLALTPITQARASLAEVSTHYRQLIGLDSHSLLGSLDLALDDGGPLSYAASLHRELGGQNLLASRVVLTDGATVRVNWIYSALVSANVHADALRRRYSVDLVGFPAHREYERLLGVGLVYSPLRVLSLSLSYDGDWRAANPSVFSFQDHRYALSARLSF